MNDKNAIDNKNPGNKSVDQSVLIVPEGAESIGTNAYSGRNDFSEAVLPAGISSS